MTPNSRRFWYRRKMYAAFEFRLSRRNTAEVNIGVFRRRELPRAAQRRSLKDVVRLALPEKWRSPTGLFAYGRTRGFHCDFASEFVEYLGVRPRAACPYIFSRMTVGIRIRTPTILLSLSSPSGPPSCLLFRHARFLIVNVRLFVSYLSSVFSSEDPVHP